jgi:inosose dehydratase
MISSRIKVGINPLTWTNDDMPELGAETPLDTCLKETKQAGYAGIELGNKFPREAKVLKPILTGHGLKLVSGWYSTNLLERSVEAEMEALEAHLHLLYSMGCTALVLCETTGAVHGDRTCALSKRPTIDEAQWKRLADGLNRLGDHVADRGIKLAYHHHMGTVVQTQAEIDTLMARTGPQVSLLLDTGHLTFAGGDPVAAAKKHGARVAHVHAKDIRKPVLEKVLKADLPFLEAVLEGVFTVPGDGCVDYPAVFKELASHHYQGWVVVEAEQDPKKANPLTYATLGFKNLTASLKAGGLLS